jgi:hypothetical protein
MSPVTTPGFGYAAGGVVGVAGAGAGLVRVGAGEAEAAPVQVVPLSVKLAGAGLVALFQDALNPNETLAPVAIVALYPASRAVTSAPACVTVAFHAWVTV